MNGELGQTYSAVAIAKRPIGHAHIVELIVERGGRYGVLRHIAAGKNRFYTRDEFNEYVDLRRVTPLVEAVDVSTGDTGLVLTNEIPKILLNAGIELSDEVRQSVETEMGHALFIGAKEELIQLRDAVASQLTVLIKESIVDQFVAKALGLESDHKTPTWEELDTWTEYAIDCGAGGMEYQYEPLLVRAWLLHSQLESTQVSNLYEVFLSEKVPRELFNTEIDEFERTIRTAVERKVWLHGLSQEGAARQETDVNGASGTADVIDIAEYSHHPRTPVG